MQRLPLADPLFAAVVSGDKTNTMRWREVRIAPGELTFFSETGAHDDVTVNVMRCTDVPLREAAALVGIESEWPDDRMLKAMQQHYPTITPEDIVQVIEYSLSSENT